MRWTGRGSSGASSYHPDGSERATAMLPDTDRVSALIREIAAEEMMPRFATLSPEEIAEKKPGDFVTAVDLASERRFTRALPDLLPGSLVLGEEAVSENPAQLRMLSGDDPVWVVDPLDGTANFAAGLPIFAVIVALVCQGRTEKGWIHDPATGRMAVASRGEGAWMADRRLRVRRPESLRRMNGSIYGRKYRGSAAYREVWGAGRGRLGQVFNARCVGQEYLARLQGRMHFGLYTRLNPWDHAAGCLMHQEAGGYLARLDGEPYTPAEQLPGVLVTPDRELWEEFRRTLIEPAERR